MVTAYTESVTDGSHTISQAATGRQTGAGERSCRRRQPGLKSTSTVSIVPAVRPGAWWPDQYMLVVRDDLSLQPDFGRGLDPLPT